MSKRKPRLDHPDQYSLLDLIKSASCGPTNDHGQGSLNVRVSFQGVLSDCIKRSPLSRWEIAGRMSTLLATEVTKYMLDTWTAESKEYHRFPAEYLPAFCEAVGSREPIRFLGKAAGVYVLRGERVLKAELANILEQRRELNSKIRHFKHLLKIMPRSERYTI